ncbi:hypothetical protein PCASD_16102 [Puccinia coronata f. sp. avenae]|uniref:Uncharacterized protein n=1 Tax=Puccinia coronata f. sp. avenae TaxID=200324 RepID=A0A2N5TY21_9BASI|nr:hypothetical protein PCASD_16102 [Puccinia coronata f. sp. avenae]
MMTELCMLRPPRSIVDRKPCFGPGRERDEVRSSVSLLEWTAPPSCGYDLMWGCFEYFDAPSRWQKARKSLPRFYLFSIRGSREDGGRGASDAPEWDLS